MKAWPHFKLKLYMSSLGRDVAVSVLIVLTAARLAQWDKRRPAEQEAVGSNPALTNTRFF